MEDEIRWFKEMMQSCYAYDSLNKENKYISKYKSILGEELFNQTYEDYSKYLKENYKIERCVHTDNEGLTYNSLIKIK